MLHYLLLGLILCLSLIYGTTVEANAQQQELPLDSVTLDLHVNTKSPLGSVDPRYVSFNLDWWPPKKGSPPLGWGRHANVLDVDLQSKKLQMLTKALGPSILRIGGTLEKIVKYDIPQEGLHCRQHSSGSNSPCMNMSRWKDLHEFAAATDSKIVFGLSYPTTKTNGQWDGKFNATQATALLRYSHRHNFSRSTTLYGVELGEELSRFEVGTPAFRRYVAAYKECARLLRHIYSNSTVKRPLLLGPSPGMDWPRLATWFPAFLNATSGALDVAVYHSYNQIEHDKLYLNMTIPSGNLSTQHGSSPGDTGWQAVAMRNFVMRQQQKQKRHGVPALWLGEFGPHNGGGGPGNISSTFASSFGYLDTLGTLARLNHSVLARQTLVGGKYELLQCATTPGKDQCDFEPHPDYWVALLWQRLMGITVLEAPIVQLRERKPSPGWKEPLRFHAHCATVTGATMMERRQNLDGSVTVAFSNLSPQTTYRLNIDSELLGKTRIEYVLQGHHDRGHSSNSSTTTPINGLDTTVLELNGFALRVGNKTQLPHMMGNEQVNHADNPLILPPISLGFVVFDVARAPACSSNALMNALATHESLQATKQRERKQQLHSMHSISG